jgi:hypothetical protein
MGSEDDTTNKRFVRVCTDCKRTINEHRHQITTMSVQSMRKVVEVGGWAVTSKLLKDRTPCDNFYKLKYFGLVIKVEEDGVTPAKLTASTGCWAITPLGHEYLAGKVRLIRTCWTQDDVVVEWVGEALDIYAPFEKRSARHKKDDTRPAKSRRKSVLVEHAPDFFKAGRS